MNLADITNAVTVGYAASPSPPAIPLGRVIAFATSPYAMIEKTADYVIGILKPRAKIIILAIFTYLALC